MIIATVILVSIMFGVIIPKKYFKFYMFISIMGISSLYFYFVPTKIFDLFRHYETIKYIESYSVYQIIFEKNFLTANSLAKLYLTEYPIYCLFIKFISMFGKKELLPVTIGMISYGVPAYILIKEYSNCRIEKWKLLVAYSFIVVNIDFLSISGIRNIMAASLFVLVLYWDLVEKKNTIICFVMYIGICFIHTAGVLYLILRLMLILYNKKSSMKYVNLIFLALFFGMQQIAIMLEGVLGTGNIFYKAISSFLAYSEGGTERSIAVQGITTIVYLLCFLMCLYFRKYLMTEANKKWYQYLIINFLFIASSGIKSVDIFMRFNLILYLLMIPVVTAIMKEIFGKTVFSIKIFQNKLKQQLGIIIGSILYLEMVINFSLNIILRYRPINDCFYIWN